MKKLYIVGPNGGGDGAYHLIADDGEHLASHICSGIRYAEGDLIANRPERQEKFRKRFGKYTVLRLGDDDITLEAIQSKNAEWAAIR